jgi:flotillin
MNMASITENLAPIGVAALVLLGLVALLLAFAWREVVGTNKVHIVQSRKNTTSYGTGQSAGNVYYAIPAFIPLFGVSRIELPVNNFALNLHDYQAYDKDRVPFMLDLTAFFRIANTNMAAERVSSFEELHKQLVAIVQGAARKILASHDINSIMVDRATFGEQFTKEVATELQNWGVEPVKNMELMDIRDAGESKVIANIMAKKTSHIEMESRREVATNKQLATIAEIEAKRASDTADIEAKRRVQVSALEAQQAIGERTAEAEKLVGVAQAEQRRATGVAAEKSQQDIKAEAATTMDREMKIRAVETQRTAEIEKAAALVKADQEREVTIKVADGKLEQTKREAEGTRATGEAKADAEKAIQLAPVEAQIVLAKEIGENQGYQTYLVTLRKVEAEQAIGIAQAASLEKADIKIIANSGSASAGISGLGELISSKGGQQVGAFLDGLKNTETGAKVIERATGNGRASA